MEKQRQKISQLISAFNNRLTGTVDGPMIIPPDSKKTLLGVGGIPSILVNLEMFATEVLKCLSGVILNKADGLKLTADAVVFITIRSSLFSSSYANDIGNQWFVGYPTQIYYDWNFSACSSILIR
jgi:hypothetical protein